jgi:hypothetical protein
MHGSESESEGRFILSNQEIAKRWHEPEILRMHRSKTDQVGGTEKVLAQYPTINRLKMGELSGIQEPTNKKGLAEVGVVKESCNGVSEGVGTKCRRCRRLRSRWRSCRRCGRKGWKQMESENNKGGK